MAKPKPCRSYEFTGDILDHDVEFKKFFKGLTQYLKSKLQRFEVKGRFSYDQYSCGRMTVEIQAGGRGSTYGIIVWKQDLIHMRPEMQSRNDLV